MGRGFTHVKQKPEQPEALSALRALTAWLRKATTFNKSEWVLDCNDKTDREALISLLWSGEYSEALASVVVANPEASEMLTQLTSNSYVPKLKHREANLRHRAHQQIGLFTVMTRMRSQHDVPLLTVLLSLQAYATKVHGRFQDSLGCFFRGVMLSDKWIERLIRDGVQADPGPQYTCIEGIGATMFDNLTIKIGYKSYCTQSSGGFRCDMTNWIKMEIPRSVVGPQFDAQKIWADGLFPRTLSRARFQRAFAHDNVNISNNKAERFTRFLQHAAAGTLFDRPDYTSTWTAYLSAQPAIFGRLQGKYEDVVHEMDHILASFTAANPYFVMMGGDGLTYDRMLHCMLEHARYIARPAVVPILGLAPHGEYHVFHAGYRNYRPLIKVFAKALNNPQLTEDPPVSEYNRVRYHVSMLMLACSEYIHELAQTAGAESIELPEDFIQACEANTDLAWVVHFLYDFCYLWWDFKQSVRANKSRKLDLLWAEFVALGRTTVANKTHYGVLATMQVFYGMALHPLLADLYHATRTLHLGGGDGTNTGWDMPPERLNLALKTDVTCNFSESLINRRIQDHRFLETVDSGLMKIVHSERKKQEAKMKEWDEDKRIIKDLLRSNIGTTWARATRQNARSQLGVDAKFTVPWIAVLLAHVKGTGGGDKTMAEYVQEHVERLEPRQRWVN